jgi:hypothetical protein
MGFFIYGGLVAIQTLWATPWMIRVGGYTPLEAASGLFWINVAMLVAFWVWGMINPWLTRQGHTAERLIAYGMPPSFLILALIIIAGDTFGSWFGVILALYCVSCTFISLAQPAVAMAFPATLAGRVLSSYNLLLFAGVFTVQWGVGLAIDGFKAIGATDVQSFQYAMGIYLICSLLSYVYFLFPKSHNR